MRIFCPRRLTAKTTESIQNAALIAVIAFSLDGPACLAADAYSSQSPSGTQMRTSEVTDSGVSTLAPLTPPIVHSTDKETIVLASLYLPPQDPREKFGIGGWGRNHSELKCSVGYVVGFKLMQGDLLDQIKIYCSNPIDDGNWPPSPVREEAGSAGGQGGAAVPDHMCNRDRFLIGFAATLAREAKPPADTGTPTFGGVITPENYPQPGIGVTPDESPVFLADLQPVCSNPLNAAEVPEVYPANPKYSRAGYWQIPWLPNQASCGEGEAAIGVLVQWDRFVNRVALLCDKFVTRAPFHRDIADLATRIEPGPQSVHPRPMIRDAHFNVPANEQWVSTGIALTHSEHLTITASGQWSNAGPPALGPDGFPNFRYPGTKLPSANLGSLIGRIGNTIFNVGTQFSGSAPDSGTLFFSINDTPESFSDNQGVLDVAVSVP